jgi:hypothetical protein
VGVGVVAANKARAQHVVDELGITNGIALARSKTSARGMRLDAMLIDETALPLTDGIAASLTAAVPNGRIYTIQRVKD